jgi:PD-(D/E)XK nuclease superfamily
VPEPVRIRQSLLRSFYECPLRAVNEIEHTAGNVGESADLGSALHAVVAEVLRTLCRTGEAQMPHQESVEVLYEVVNAGPWVLSPESHDWLRQMVLNFCELEIRPERILRIEEQLSTAIVCPDGVTRILTGTPDLLVADPGDPPGVVIEDYKSSLGVPRNPRSMPAEGEPIVGEQYLHEGGHTQLRIYGLLAMRTYPRVQFATLRQRNLRWNGPPREASITRDQLEHVERQVGLLLMQVDTARNGDPLGLVRPRPGAWCARRCPIARACPVPAEQRGVGALETDEMADAEAARFVVVDGLRKTLLAALKARYEATGRPMLTGDGRALAWNGGAGSAFQIIEVDHNGDEVPRETAV